VSASAPAAPIEAAGGAALDQRLARAWRTEIAKLAAQPVLRLIVVLAVLGPFAFGLLLKIQSGTPSDALFGVYVHDSGFAVSLVVLSFAGNWGVPIIAGLVAGDMFSGEDRHNTWKTILTRSCSLGDLFAAKLLAAASVVCGLVLLAGLASIVAGIVFVGAHPLVNLGGQEISAGRALGLTALAWVLCLLPALSYTGLAILFSVASRNGIVGVVGPLVAAMATLLLNLIGQGVWVHLLLVGATFTNEFGLFAAHPFLGPLAVTLIAGLVWAAGSLAAAWLILRRRDFLAGASGVHRAGWQVPARLAVAVAATVGVLALACNLGPVGVTKVRVQNAVAATFSNASLLQQALLGRHPPAGARLDVQPYCGRGAGVRSRGPGDWLCNVFVYLPQLKSTLTNRKGVPFQRTNVEYDVSVSSNGCFKAESPPTFIGNPTMSDASGARTTNPLYVVYGCFNPL
jgi:ABC-2 type transport system permease protein